MEAARTRPRKPTSAQSEKSCSTASKHRIKDTKFSYAVGTKRLPTRSDAVDIDFEKIRLLSSCTHTTQAASKSRKNSANSSKCELSRCLESSGSTASSESSGSSRCPKTIISLPLPKSTVRDVTAKTHSKSLPGAQNVDSTHIKPAVKKIGQVRTPWKTLNEKPVKLVDDQMVVDDNPLMNEEFSGKSSPGSDLTANKEEGPAQEILNKSTTNVTDELQARISRSDGLDPEDNINDGELQSSSEESSGIEENGERMSAAKEMNCSTYDWARHVVTKITGKRPIMESNIINTPEVYRYKKRPETSSTPHNRSVQQNESNKSLSSSRLSRTGLVIVRSQEALAAAAAAASAADAMRQAEYLFGPPEAP